MFNQEVALNNQAWEEITDIQGEAITGGAPPTSGTLLQTFAARIGTIYEKNKNYNGDTTRFVVETVLNNNGAIEKFLQLSDQDIADIIAAIPG